MIKIATHNAKFHTDDVFAVAALFLNYGEENCKVIRTRDPEEISKAYIVVDVGSVYDPARRRFDHHQKEGAGERENGIPYASFGLMWKEYGEKICGSKDVSDFIDSSLVQQIDASDNGKDMYVPVIKDVFPYTLTGVIDSYRSTWKEEENWDGRFLEAVHFAKELLLREIKRAGDHNEGERIVIAVYQASEDKRLITIPEEFDLGRELASRVLGNYKEPLFVKLCRRDHNQTWQLVTIREDKGSFVSRKSLPESWRGKENKELEEASGVMGAVFCHRSGFMCVAKTKEAIDALGEIALKA